MSTGLTIPVYVSALGEELPPERYNALLHQLPADLHPTINRFMFWQDRQRSLLGKLLLLKGLEPLGYDAQTLKELTYTWYKRPELPLPLDFNISHSGEYIICAVSTQGRVGVDVEQVRNTELDVFRNLMTVEQWAEIDGAPSPKEAFFRYWAIKESVIKANGKGLSIPLDELEVRDEKVSHEGKVWHLTEFEIGEGHASCLATDVKEVIVETQFVTIA